MTETLTGTPARNYVGGEWLAAGSGETYRSSTPGARPRCAGSTRHPARKTPAAIVAAREAFPGWATLPRLRALRSSTARPTRSTRARSGSLRT